MKRKEKPIDALRSYLYRNNKEDELPEGFISKTELKSILQCSDNQFSRVVPALVARKEIERIVLKRVKDGRIYKMPFFKLSKGIAKMVGLASR